MPRRRTGRFVLEALFLAAVAAAATVAELHAFAVIALMAAAWVVVALLEWTALRDEPHYGRGLPPRFFVPQVALPPSRLVEQPGYYPVLHAPDDAPTFEASVTEWAAALGDWPAVDGSLADEETQIAAPGEHEYGYDLDDLDTGEDATFPPEIELAPEREPAPELEAPVVEAPLGEKPMVEEPAGEAPAAEMPAAEIPAIETPLAEVPLAEAPVAEAPVPEVPAVETPADALPLDAPPGVEPVTPDAPRVTPAPPPGAETPLPAREPASTPVLPSMAPMVPLEVAVPFEAAVPERPEPIAAPAPVPVKARLVPVERVPMTTIHHVDPLAVTTRRRFFRRAAEESVVEVPDGPPPDRVLPSHLLPARRTAARKPRSR